MPSLPLRSKRVFDPMLAVEPITVRLSMKGTQVNVEKTIRDVLAQYGNLPAGVGDIEVDTDLYQAGLTSHASVNIMLALENAFGVEFPDALLKKNTFQSITAISDVLNSLGVSSAD